MTPTTLSKADALDELRAEDNECRRMSREKGRTQYVFGTGSAGADVIFIGEAPGAEEDRTGEPFVGRAGKLLDKLIASIGLSRETVYITNVVKFRPMKDPAHPGRPGNDRPPTKYEIAACLHILEKQIGIIRPRVICTLGNTPTRALLRTPAGIRTLHGIRTSFNGIPLVPTYHPAAVFHNPYLLQDIEKDFQKIKEFL